MRTRWVRDGTDVEKTALMMGIQPSVLEEARKSYAAQHPKPSRSRTYTLELAMPEALYRRFQILVNEQRVLRSLLLRGLVEVLLRSGKPPSSFYPSWTYRGKIYLLKKPPPGKPPPWRLKSEISRGAAHALADIAAHYNSTRTALVRSQIIDYMEGRVPHVLLIPVDEMAQDPRKYLAAWGL